MCRHMNEHKDPEPLGDGGGSPILTMSYPSERRILMYLSMLLVHEEQSQQAEKRDGEIR